MKRILLLSAAFGLAASGAIAGNVIPPEPDPAPYVPAPSVYDWSGAYFGGYAGQGMGTMEYENPAVGPYDLDPNWSYGAFAGYNWQAGNLVYGVEASVGLFQGFPVGFPTESYDYIADARARVGHAMDNVLVYGFAGGSIGQYTISGTPPSWTIYGANYGAGLEFGVTDNLSIGGEYVGHYLTSSDTNNPGQNQNTVLHELRARAAVRF